MKTEKPRIAKARVGLAADGVTLVDPDSDQSVALFAAEGATIQPKYLAGKKNVEKYFDEPAKEKAPEKKEYGVVAKIEPDGAKRVVNAPAPVEKKKPAKVRK